MSSKHYYYCEICDYTSDAMFHHCTHLNSNTHIKKCNNYKTQLKSEKEQLKAFADILKDSLNFTSKNDNEICDKTIELITNYKLPIDKINEIKQRNKEFEMIDMSLKK